MARDREMTIHRSRVHQLERAALAKMRAACEAVGLAPSDFVQAWRTLPSAIDGNRRTPARGGC